MGRKTAAFLAATSLLIAFVLLPVLVLVRWFADFRYVASGQWIEFSNTASFWLAICLAAILLGYVLFDIDSSIKSGTPRKAEDAFWSAIALGLLVFFLSYFSSLSAFKGPIGSVIASFSNREEVQSVELRLDQERISSVRRLPDQYAWEFPNDYQIFALPREMQGLAERLATVTFFGPGNWAGIRYSEVHIENPGSNATIIVKLEGGEVEVLRE